MSRLKNIEYYIYYLNIPRIIILLFNLLYSDYYFIDTFNRFFLAFANPF